MIAIAVAFFEFVAGLILMNHAAPFAAGLAFAFAISIIIIESAGNYWRRA